MSNAFLNIAQLSIAYLSVIRPSTLHQILPIAHPSEQRVVARVPYEENHLADPEGELVDPIDGDKHFDVIEKKEVVQYGRV